MKGLRFTVTAALLLAVAAVLAVGLALQRVPLVAPPAALSQADIGQALQSLRAQDPRRLRPGAQGALVLTQRELELWLNQAASRWQPMAVQVELQAGLSRLRASVELEHSPVGRWLNIDALLRQTDGLPELERLRLGRLPVPAWIGTRILHLLVARLDRGTDVQMAGELVRRVEIRPGQLRVLYVWRADLVERMRASLLPPAEQARMKAYAERLAGLGAVLPADQEVSLALLLPPMFDLARQRSETGEDASLENRAAILALVLMANGRGFGALAPAARAWPRPPPKLLTLGGRDDLAKHFLVSALLALEGGGPLADAIGLFKEVDDARVGSGFSFNDIAAGRAGVRFAGLAAASPRQLQAVLAAGIAEGDVMPEVADLPEFMPQAEFQRRFGAIGSPAYAAMMARIEARLEALPLARRCAALAGGASTAAPGR